MTKVKKPVPNLIDLWIPILFLLLCTSIGGFIILWLGRKRYEKAMREADGTAFLWSDLNGTETMYAVSWDDREDDNA